MALLGRKSRAPRRLADRQAWIVVENSFALRPCKVVDISDQGARLDLDEADRLPKFFDLTFTRASRAGRRCELRWRRGRTAGVKFVTGAS
jgi:hypothetical protein